MGLFLYIFPSTDGLVNVPITISRRIEKSMNERRLLITETEAKKVAPDLLEQKKSAAQK
jgi:hypothetical protein